MPKKKENLSPEEILAKAIIPKEEEPYKLPDNWVWTKIKNVNEVVTGNTPSKKIEEYWENKDINFVKPSDLFQERNLKFSEEFIDFRAEEKVKIIPKFSTILCCIGSIGKSAFSEIECCTNQQINSLIPNYSLLNSLYNYYYVSSSFFINQMKNSSSATTISILNKSKTEELYFPLPPLNEQKRIVEKLDFLFEKTGKIKEIIEEVKEKTVQRREAVLSKAFTGELTEKWRSKNPTNSAKELLSKINDEKLRTWEEECKKAEEDGRKKPSKPRLSIIDEIIVSENEKPYEVPDNWVWTRVGNVTNYGEVKQVKAEGISENAWILELEDIEKSTFKLLNKVLKKERQNKSNKHIFFKGDILYSKLRPYLNKILIAEEDGYATTEIIPFKGLFNLDNKYIFYYFTFSKTIEMINFLTHGMQMPRLGTDKARNLLFPLPPLEEQKEIVRILDKVFEEENRISELISLEEKVEVLEKTILDKAFRGELGTGNIDDEPALELLKKVIK